MLRDPRFAGKRISDICELSGFGDLSYFKRLPGVLANAQGRATWFGPLARVAMRHPGSEAPTVYRPDKARSERRNKLSARLARRNLTIGTFVPACPLARGLQICMGVRLSPYSVRACPSLSFLVGVNSPHYFCGLKGPKTRSGSCTLSTDRVTLVKTGSRAGSDCHSREGTP